MVRKVVEKADEGEEASTVAMATAWAEVKEPEGNEIWVLTMTEPETTLRMVT